MQKVFQRIWIVLDIINNILKSPPKSHIGKAIIFKMASKMAAIA